MFLDKVYGYKSILSYQEWLDLVVKEARWVFYAEELRKKIFEAAGIEVPSHGF